MIVAVNFQFKHCMSVVLELAYNKIAEFVSDIIIWAGLKALPCRIYKPSSIMR